MAKDRPTAYPRVPDHSDPLQPTAGEIGAAYDAVERSGEDHVCEGVCHQCAGVGLRAANALALPRLISAVVAAMPAVDEDDIVGLAGQWINRHDLELLLLAAAARLVKEER